MEKATTKKAATKKRETMVPTLVHLDAETKAIMEEDSAGCGLSSAAYVRMLIRKERTAQNRANAAGR
jgi:hypothetical protein